MGHLDTADVSQCAQFIISLTSPIKLCIYACLYKIHHSLKEVYEIQTNHNKIDTHVSTSPLKETQKIPHNLASLVSSPCRILLSLPKDSSVLCANNRSLTFLFIIFYIFS